MHYTKYLTLLDTLQFSVTTYLPHNIHLELNWSSRRALLLSGKLMFNFLIEQSYEFNKNITFYRFSGFSDKKILQSANASARIECSTSFQLIPLRSLQQIKQKRKKSLFLQVVLVKKNSYKNLMTHLCHFSRMNYSLQCFIRFW